MESEGSLPLSQEPATCPYPELDQSSLCLPVPRLENLFYCYLLHLRLGLPSGLFPWGFPPTKHCIHLSPIRAKCPTHFILDLITRTIFGEQYRSSSSWLCSFLHSPVSRRPKFLPQHPILRHTRTTFLPKCEGLSFTVDVAKRRH